MRPVARSAKVAPVSLYDEVGDMGVIDERVNAARAARFLLTGIVGSLGAAAM